MHKQEQACDAAAHLSPPVYESLHISQVEKVKKAVEIAKQTRPDLFLEGKPLFTLQNCAL